MKKDKTKDIQKSGKKETALIRSSAAEYLTFVAAGGNSETSVEMQAMRKIPMTMTDWEERLSRFLKMWDRELLQDAGRVIAELVKAHAESEFENTASFHKLV